MTSPIITSVAKHDALSVGAGGRATGGTALGVWSKNGRAGANGKDLELMPLTANPELNYAPSTVSGISG